MTTLAQYLRRNNMRPTRFARKIKCWPSTVTRILHGQEFPRPATMRKIYVGTGGVVMPRSFYDLPKLNKNKRR